MTRKPSENSLEERSIAGLSERSFASHLTGAGVSRRGGALLSKPTLAAMLGLALGLLAVGWWMDAALLRHSRRQIRSQVETTLATTATTLRAWARHQRDIARTLARDPRLREPALELANQLASPVGGPAVGSGGRAAANAPRIEGPSASRLRASLRDALDRQGYLHAMVVRHDGRALVIRPDEENPRPTSIALSSLPSLRLALEGRETFSRPTRDLRFEADGPSAPALSFVAAPIWDARGQVAAILVLSLDPTQEFSRTLHIARTGESGETYAFDDSGNMLSASRFPAQLRRLGLLPDDEAATSVLTVGLRDPGRELQPGENIEQARAEWPLTRMARSAIAGRSGADAVGYRDYRGVMVVGAWTWIPELDLGLATEVDAAEAFGPHRVVRVGLWTLFFVILLSGVGLVAYTGVVRVLRRRVDSARSLGQYRLVGKVGEGGMGVVYRAEHALLARPVALKLIDARESSAEHVTRFEREVQATAMLTHPNTIQVFDYGQTPDREFYYVMELLEGVELQALIDREAPLPIARAVHLLRQIVGSIAESHTMGMVHRDIKPANIMVTSRGGVRDFVKVLDFGLVREVFTDSTQLTSSHSITGTPLYMAPEQIGGSGGVGPASDVYQIGCVAYAILTGSPPFKTNSVVSTLHKHLNEIPPPPSERTENAIPAELDALVLRCLEKSPDDRPRDAAALLLELEALVVPDWTRAEAERSWSRIAALEVELARARK